MCADNWFQCKSQRITYWLNSLAKLMNCRISYSSMFLNLFLPFLADFSVAHFRLFCFPCFSMCVRALSVYRVSEMAKIEFTGHFTRFKNIKLLERVKLPNGAWQYLHPLNQLICKHPPSVNRVKKFKHRKTIQTFSSILGWRNRRFWWLSVRDCCDSDAIIQSVD